MRSDSRHDPENRTDCRPRDLAARLRLIGYSLESEPSNCVVGREVSADWHRSVRPEDERRTPPRRRAAAWLHAERMHVSLISTAATYGQGHLAIGGNRSTHRSDFAIGFCTRQLPVLLPSAAEARRPQHATNDASGHALITVVLLALALRLAFVLWAPVFLSSECWRPGH